MYRNKRNRKENRAPVAAIVRKKNITKNENHNF